MRSFFTRGQSGAALLETVVALVIMGAIAVAFLTGLAVSSRASVITDEQTTAESLARRQMEWVKNTAYVHSANGYTPPAPSGDEYAGYTSVVAAQPLHDPDAGIQRITVAVSRNGREIFSLQSYKVSR